MALAAAPTAHAHDGPSHAHLAIRSAAQVNVRVDGVLAGPTPVERLDLSPGAHVVEVDSECFEAYSVTVHLQEGSSSSVLLEPSALTRRVTISTVDTEGRPVTATLRSASGRVIGPTPLTARLERCAEIDWKADAEGFGATPVRVGASAADATVEIALKRPELQGAVDAAVGRCKMPDTPLEYPAGARARGLEGVVEVIMLGAPGGRWLNVRDPRCTHWREADADERRTLWHPTHCIGVAEGPEEFGYEAVRWAADIDCKGWWTQFSDEAEPTWMRIPLSFQLR